METWAIERAHMRADGPARFQGSRARPAASAEQLLAGLLSSRASAGALCAHLTLVLLVREHCLSASFRLCVRCAQHGLPRAVRKLSMLKLPLRLGVATRVTNCVG
jgi:hypothetical protein